MAAARACTMRAAIESLEAEIACLDLKLQNPSLERALRNEYTTDVVDCKLQIAALRLRILAIEAGLDIAGAAAD